TELGWRDAMLALGAGFFVLFPLMFLLRPAPATQASGQAAPRDANLWNLPHTITLPWLGLAALFCCICMAVPQVHLIALGIDLGCSPQTAAGLLLTVMVTAVFGRLFFGWLACPPISWPRWRKLRSCSSSRKRKASPRCISCRCCSDSVLPA